MVEHFLASVRPRIQTPVPQKKKNERNKETKQRKEKK
jgi:hypothetical protein